MFNSIAEHHQVLHIEVDNLLLGSAFKMLEQLCQDITLVDG
jgi:hypothetical protein